MGIVKQASRLAIAVAVAMTTILATQTPAQARIGTGAAVGIGLGSFALGSALGAGAYYNPYYYPYGYDSVEKVGACVGKGSLIQSCRGTEDHDGQSGSRAGGSVL
jgi:hypothetical protein